MIKAEASGLERSAPVNTSLPLNACLQSRAPMGMKRTGKPEIHRTPPKRQRASKHQVDVALRVRVGDITAAPTRPPRPVLRDPSPIKYGCEPHGILRQHDRRTVSGKAPCSLKIIGLSLRMPSPGSKERTRLRGTGARARSNLASRTRPCRKRRCLQREKERRREGLCECMRGAVFQPPTPTVDSGCDSRPRSPLRQGKQLARQRGLRDMRAMSSAQEASRGC